MNRTSTAVDSVHWQWCVLIAGMLLGRSVAAFGQTEYYNLDSNRPLRVEDAVPTEQRALDIQLAPLRLETYAEGARRWRIDPKLSYGIAPLTEIELRLAAVLIDPGRIPAPSAAGLTSVGIGAMRALTTETTHVPAMALGGEVLVPAGSLAPPNASYAVKALLTKTTPSVRVSVNASYGTYSVVPVLPVSPSCRLEPPGAPGCGNQPTVPDVPCARIGTGAELDRTSLESELTPGVPPLFCAALPAPASSPPRNWGQRWFAGAAVDHAFALSSTLVAADLFAEHLVGLYPRIDWTAEIGVRRQWSPQLVLDAGIGRRFAGNLPTTTLTVGATYIVAAGR
jgi:hypothetical protein